MARVKVKLSHRPEHVEVERDEIPGLVAQGLLKEEDVPPEEDATANATAAGGGQGEAAPGGRTKSKSADSQGA